MTAGRSRAALRAHQTGTALAVLLLVACSGDPPLPDAAFRPPELATPGRLLAGVGDRLWWWEPGRPPVFLPDQARRAGLPTDLVQIWLPRGWKESWVPARDLTRLAHSGSVPVVVEYFFDRGISRQRVRAQRDAWHRHLRRVADAVRGPAQVLVVLAPEFNDAPPPGETAITRWRGFNDELAAALRIFRERAPNARVGVCAGDFSPDRDLRLSVGAVAPKLDFIAFQEMRARGDRDARARGYLDVGGAALSYARYLRREFDRPVLLAYAAISSHGGWEAEQLDAVSSLVARAPELHAAGVFGAIWFQLRDDPEHTGYFGAAETGFGLLDARGRPKPAARIWAELAADPGSP